jgi:hypothetical protein
LTLIRGYEQIKNNPFLKTLEEGMGASVQLPAVLRLREQIQRLEGAPLRARAVLPFGVAAIDSRLPGGGLALGALHEVAGGGNAAIDGAAAALFAAGIAARTKGKVLWCITRQDLFAPALAQVGLAADRVIYVDACDEKSVLACFEEGVRHGGLGAVVAEVARLSMTSSRRLTLAAADRGRGLRSADRVGDEVAGIDAAVDAAPGAGRWPREVVARVDPMPRRRKRGFCSGCV